MAVYRIYNYPWSGRLGNLTECCIYCGDSGAHFQISSFGDRCTKCKPGGEPIPELLDAMNATYLRKANAWCEERGIDFEATVANYEKHLGVPHQDLDAPPDQHHANYTIYLPGRRPMKGTAS